MLANQGYAAYANNKIMTASPAELTLMLYEGAIKFCNLAISAVEEKQIEKAHINSVKVEVYSYLLMRLKEANFKKDKEILEEVLKHLRTMRDTWKEVMRLSKVQ